MSGSRSEKVYPTPQVSLHTRTRAREAMPKTIPWSNVLREAHQCHRLLSRLLSNVISPYIFRYLLSHFAFVQCHTTRKESRRFQIAVLATFDQFLRSTCRCGFNEHDDLFFRCGIKAPGATALGISAAGFDGLGGCVFEEQGFGSLALKGP